jgi:uncharacterized protein YdeI (BOF family)
MTMNTKFKKMLWLPFVAMANTSMATDYQWNNPAPIKVPTDPNGKIVLFDASHGGTEGNADWVIDGGFSDFSDALVSEGYQVEEYRGVDLNNDGNIQYLDDLNTPANASLNEAIITYEAISHADVLVLAETNRPFKISEYQALLEFVESGKGIYFIADHYNADRNLNTWDATEVFNGYNRSTLEKFNFGGEYGDLRNPGDSQGWLANHFGVRFRFNALDYLAGASDITSAVNSEGITQDVEPILMAAGATLAITDANKAKGLVYFSQTDNATKWNYAIDEGVYFGGRDEGPYVAISKLGLGKAAFIGDSSPIEDATPKYKRQDSGSTKKTYPGWTDPGQGATLSINIVNWLATPESYSHFDNQQGHTAGQLTPIAKAPVEMDDPDNGNPWSNPSNGYNPWDTNSFAYGSFGAPQGPTGPTDPTDPTDPIGNELSVSQVLALSNGSSVTLIGKATSAINGIYALQLNDKSNPNDAIYIKLESEFRDAFSPELNPDVLGATLLVTGIKNDYLSSPGVRSVTSMNIVPDALSVTQALNQPNGSNVVVEGIISSAVNDIYALLLTDENNDASQLNIKLESEQRSQFSPILNPSILQHKIRVSGVRNDYMSQPGVKSVTDITDLGLVSDDTNPTSLSVSEVLNTATGTQVILSGYVQASLNGIYGLLLQDENDASQTINVKLDSQYRQQFNPQLNPSMLGARLLISGKRDAYMGKAGIRYIDNIEVLGD